MSDGELSTSTMLQRIFKTTSIGRFIKRYDKQMENAPFHIYISRLCENRNIVPERVIRKSGIERTYGHQLFNGRRKPSRDKVLQLAFGLGMNYNEVQELLKVARKSALYPRVKRDAVIIYALKRRLSFEDVQTTLFELSLPLLGKEDRNE